MARQITDEARIEQFFTHAEPMSARASLEKIRLILRVRGVIEQKAKRGRPVKLREPKKPAAPPPAAA